MARGRDAVDALRDAPGPGDLGRDLGAGQHASVAGLGALGQFDLDHPDLRIGGLTLNPAFSAGTLTGYTASTTNASNTVTAIPADANATIEITNKGPSDEQATPVVNGRAVTWKTGANTLTVKVTAENGAATQSYVVTVTKS